MRINLNSDQAIFRPPHKLGQVEWDFVDSQCKKLKALGFIQRSTQSQYASATVVVGKKDLDENYTDFRQCGDYRPLNMDTTLDRYPLPGIEDIFNQMGGATIFPNWICAADTTRCRSGWRIEAKRHFGELIESCGSG